MSAIDDGAAPGPSAEPGASAAGDDPLAGQARSDAFISYRRLPADMAFVDQLQGALAARGKHVWVDRTNIEPAADWSERIVRGIEAAKAFIFVVTPESVVSEQCRRELETAVQYHKLIVPVVLRDTARQDLPSSLLKPNWIFFGPGHDAERGLDGVITALEEDIDWRDAHTRLAVRTKEWVNAQRDRSFLLRGSDLRLAEEWLGQASLHEKTSPTALQTEYILASRKAATRTQRTWRTALSVGLIVSLALAALAFAQRQQAIHQRDVAISGKLISQSQALGDADPTISKLLSIAAWSINRSSDARYAMLTAAARRGIATLVSHGPVNSVAFSPDGKTLATGTEDLNGAALWNMAARGQKVGDSLASDGPVNSVAFSPDGKTLATSNNNTGAVLYDVASRRQTGDPLTGAPLIGSVWVMSVAFSPDGKTLATGGDDGMVQLWDVAARGLIADLRASGTDSVRSLAFSPDGKTLATGADKAVRLWDVASRRQIGRSLAGHTDSVMSVAFSPDGKTLATGGADGTMRLWDVAVRRQIGDPHTSYGTVISVAFSPDGKTLATGTGGGTVLLWDAKTHIAVDLLTGATSWVNSVAFSPDSKTLASGSQDGTVRMWDVASRQIGNPLTSPSGPVASVAFSPDGRTLATRSDGTTVRLWDVASHRQIRDPLTGATNGVTSVAFSPDGKTLASGSDDGTVRLWDVATRQNIGAVLARHTGPVNSVAFSPDGKTLASGSDDGTVRLWTMAHVVDPLRQLCASAERSLTRAEWTQYVPPGPTYREVCP